jgi:hypothetical protein
MNLKAVCQKCGKILYSASKEDFNDREVAEIEKMVQCSEHGGNTYEYEQVEELDENGQSFDPPQFYQGNLISETIVVRALKIQE